MPKHSTKSESMQSDASSSSIIRIGLLDWYDFISPNEYSENTIGPFSFLLRRSVGDINFSDVFNDYFIRIQSKQSIDILNLLRYKREHLQKIDASIEKCLILNRWIKYIEQNQENFMTLIHKIQTNMNNQIEDNQTNQIINYPNDFRQREQDFQRRVDTQNIRRLFYYSINESKAPSIIYLQNRTTEHLKYIIDSTMKNDRIFQKIGLSELENIFRTSFMIINQPHCGTAPVLIYEREKSQTYKAKVSVIIVSLLHDFMQTYPNMIELNDIELTLCSTNNFYQLDGYQKLSWKTSELQINSNEKSSMIQYVELNDILIKQISTKNKQKHTFDELYSLTFLISFRLNIKQENISKFYQIPLQSSSFAIGTHNSHIPYLLTKVMINDIRQFSQTQSIDVKILSTFVLRYFIHRTGVYPKDDFQMYLREKLTNVKNENFNEELSENIFTNILFLFINQIEFMAKHPILILFYTDGIFLGPCNSEQVARVMKQIPDDVQSSIIALRFNSIDTSSESSNNFKVINTSMKAPPCYVRVDIYNSQTRFFQNRTFNSKELIIDILNFVLTAKETNADYICILSHASNTNNLKNYQLFTKYYHGRLNEIYKLNEKYKPLIDLLVHIEEKSTHHSANDRQNINSSFMSINNEQIDSSISSMGNNYANIFNYNNHNDQLMSTNILLQNNSISYSQQPTYSLCNDQQVIDYVLNHPRLLRQILCQFREMHISNRNELVQQQPVSTMDIQQYSYSTYQQLPTTFEMTNQSNSTIPHYLHVPSNLTQTTTESIMDMNESLFEPLCLKSLE